MEFIPEITGPKKNTSSRVGKLGKELALASLIALAANGCVNAPVTQPQKDNRATASPACVYRHPLSGEKIEGKWSLCTDELAYPDTSLGDTRAFTDEIYDKTYAVDVCAPLTEGKTFYRDFPGSRTAFSVMCLAYDEADQQLHQGEGCGGNGLTLYFPSRAFGTEITKLWAMEPRFNQDDGVSPFFVDDGKRKDGVFKVNFHPNSQRCGFHAVVYNGFGIRLE